MSVIAILCLPLAVAGITGALVEVAQQGSREIGLRLALGAEPRDIQWLLARTPAGTLGIGLAIGLAIGFLVSRSLAAQLFGVRAMEPASIAGAVLVLLAAGLLGFIIPARRAMRIESARVLSEL